jgi:hypothetical protein
LNLVAMTVIRVEPGSLSVQDAMDLVDIGVATGRAIPVECYLPEERERATQEGWESIGP